MSVILSEAIHCGYSHTRRLARHQLTASWRFPASCGAPGAFGVAFSTRTKEGGILLSSSEEGEERTAEAMDLVCEIHSHSLLLTRKKTTKRPKANHGKNAVLLLAQLRSWANVEERWIKETPPWVSESEWVSVPEQSTTIMRTSKEFWKVPSLCHLFL